MKNACRIIEFGIWSTVLLGVVVTLVYFLIANEGIK